MLLSRKFFKYAAAAGAIAGAVALHHNAPETVPEKAPAPHADLIADFIKTDAIETARPVIIGKGPRKMTGLETLNFAQGTFFAFNGEASPLNGYTAYCNRMPKDCDHRSDYQAAVTLNDKTFQKFLRVNIDANAAINPVSDEDNYKQSEYWAEPKFVEGKGLEGDCEDYVLFKIKQLEKIGVPRSAMSIIYVSTPQDEGHAILAVRTNKGDLLFDNLTNALNYPQETKYKFHSATSLTNDKEWQTVAGVVPGHVASKGGRLLTPEPKTP